MADRISYVGLDVHKDSIVVAVASGGLRGEVREYGRIANTATALDRLLKKLGEDGMTLRFCYEAGPCGYGIQRRLSGQGHECIVVAPSLIPKRAGDRVKTDRRDAASLARLHRAGELTAVWVPDAGHEAMRDLVRARLDAVHALRRARQQLSGFLLRQGCHYGRPAWTKLHRRWLAGLKFEQAVHHLVLEDYVLEAVSWARRVNRKTDGPRWARRVNRKTDPREMSTSPGMRWARRVNRKTDGPRWARRVNRKTDPREMSTSPGMRGARRVTRKTDPAKGGLVSRKPSFTAEPNS